MEQEELTSIIAENLTKYRKASGLTQLELAEKLNYSDKSVSKWEQGNGLPDVFVLHTLAGIYGISEGDFFVRHEEIKPKAVKKKNAISHSLIMAMSVGICWLIAVLVFVCFKIFAPAFGYAWMAFIYALPVSSIVLLVLCWVWKFYVLRSVSASAIIWTTLLVIFLTMHFAGVGGNLPMLFILGVPLQGLALLWFVFRNRFLKRKQ